MVIASTTRAHLEHVARGSVVNLVGAGVSAIAGLALVMVVTNGFSTATAGVFFAAMSAFVLVNALATLGADSGLARFMLLHERTGRAGDNPLVLRAAYAPVAIFSLLLGAIGFVVAGPLAGAMGIASHGGDDAIRVMSLVLPFSTISAVSLSATRAFGHMQPTAFIDGMARSTAQPILAGLCAATGAGVVSLSVGWGLPYVGAAAVSTLVLVRFMQERGQRGSSIAPQSPYRKVRAEFWRFTWPRGVTRLAQMTIQRLDIVLVAALRSPTEAAIYTAATRFVVLGQFGSQAIQQVLQPKFTALLADRDHTSLASVYRISTGWSIVVAWPLYVVIGLAPAVYLGMFGDAYRDGAIVVVLLAVAMMYAVATGPADTLLLMSGRSGLSLANSLIALAVDVTLCLVLIPPHGIIGAAIAWAAAVMVRCTLALVQVQVLLGIASLGRPAMMAAAANLVAIGVPVGVAVTVATPTLTLLIVLSLPCVPLFLLALWVSRDVLMLGAFRDVLRRQPSR